MSAAQMSRLYEIIKDVDFVDRESLAPHEVCEAARAVLRQVLKTRSYMWARMYISSWHNEKLVDFVKKIAAGYLSNSLKVKV